MFALCAPVAFQTGRYLRLSFGAFVRVAAGQAAATFKTGTTPITSSRPHPADDRWHFIGLTAATHGEPTLIPQLYLEGVGEAFITTPTLTFGGRPQLEAAPITGAGGVMTGTLSTGLATITDADFAQPLRLVLPRQGNTFIVQVTGAVQRINDATADRFPPGTVIRLLFDAPTTLIDGAYLNLMGGNFVAGIETSITLVSDGPGTWREVSRAP